MNTITFVLSNTPNPRLQKRAMVLKDSFACNLVCIRRKNADLYNFASSLYVHVAIKDAVVPPSSKLFSRVAFQFSVLRWQMREAMDQKPKILYVQGFDCLIAACCVKRKMKSNDLKIVYEVSDIREALFGGGGLFRTIRARLLGAVERACLRNTSLLVVTSPAFVEARYGALFDPSRIVFIPNTPSLEPFAGYCRKVDGPFTVGYVGVLRYIENLKLAIDAVSRTPGTRMILSGGSASGAELEVLERYCEGNSSVEFTGPYEYEKEIAGIYGRFDCVWAVYDSSNPNVRIALPNKLYESVYCGLPLIAARGTYLGEIVEKLGIGMTVDSSSPESIDLALALMSERGPRYLEMCDACAHAKEELCDMRTLKALPDTLRALLADFTDGLPNE